jgi:hypothetical protein
VGSGVLLYFALIAKYSIEMRSSFAIRQKGDEEHYSNRTEMGNKAVQL